MKFLKQHTNSILLCLFEILVGILLLVNPVRFTSGIIIAFGVVLIVLALVCIINYFRLDAVAGAASQALVKGLIALAAGAFCAFRTHWFIVTFPILTILYGVAVLITGFVKVQWAVDAMRLKTGKWGLPAVSAVISILCAAVILGSPFESTVVLWMFTGASLIVEAVFDIVVMVFLERNVESRAEG